ncbi:hypothetical protein CsSME_00015236 [Camellia sinensis var. sinensis]
MVASAISAPLSFSIASRNRASLLSFASRSNLLCRNSTKSIICALPSPYGDSSTIGLSNGIRGVPLKLEEQATNSSLENPKELMN